MKKLLLTAVAGMFFLSCQKEDEPEKKICWECSIKVVTTMTGLPDETATTTTEQWDFTESEIKQFETAGTSTTTVNGITVKTTAQCAAKN